MVSYRTKQRINQLGVIAIAHIYVCSSHNFGDTMEVTPFFISIVPGCGIKLSHENTLHLQVAVSTVQGHRIRDDA